VITPGLAVLAALSLGPSVSSVGPAPSPGAPPPTYCVEWVRQSREGYERLTLFMDRTLVWKTRRGQAEDVKRRVLEPDEADFYCRYFARPEVWEIPDDIRTGLSGDFTRTSLVTFARPDGTTRRLRFDELSPMPAGAAALRSSLEGLRAGFENPLAPASRFAPDKLSAGMVLRRFDGERFRIRLVEREKGVVELEGVTEPYREFRKIEELRFLFAAPE
jgi:hypothetical protein